MNRMPMRFSAPLSPLRLARRRPRSTAAGPRAARRLLYSARVSAAGDSGTGDAEARPPGLPEPAKLRRGVFGYRREDVDRALEARNRDLSELRQDVAALWLAFAHHDRMIREALGTGAADSIARSAPDPPSPPAPPSRPAAEPAPSPDAAAAAAGAESIGRQLSDLDEVLAAIEIATQTLERTYADEIEAARAPAPDRDEPEGNGEAAADRRDEREDVAAESPRGD